MALLSRRRRAPETELSEGAQGARLILRLAGQAAVLLTVAIGAVVLLVSVISGATISYPRTVDGVLGSVKSTDHYGWTAESIRRADLGGREPVEQQALRSVAVDLKLNRFEVVTSGVLPEPTTFVSAGKITRAVTASDQKNGQAPTVLNRVCRGEKPVSASTLAFPTVAEIRAAHPRLVTDQGTVEGQRAWMIEFKPTAALVNKLLLVGFFDAATANFQDMRPWVLSSSERAAITKGDYKVDWARLWVTRDGRVLRKIDMRLRVNGAGKSLYRLLAVLHPDTSDQRPLEDLAAGDVNCSAAAATPAPAAAATPATPAP